MLLLRKSMPPNQISGAVLLALQKHASDDTKLHPSFTLHPQPMTPADFLAMALDLCRILTAQAITPDPWIPGSFPVLPRPLACES